MPDEKAANKVGNQAENQARNAKGTADDKARGATPDTGDPREPDRGTSAWDDERRPLVEHDTSSRDDQAFGRQAARDQEIVDNLIDQGDGGAVQDVEKVEELGTRRDVPKPGSKA